MLKRENIVPGMSIITTEDNVFTIIKDGKYDSKNIPQGTILKVKSLTQNKTNPDLYLYDENNIVYIEHNFRRILSITEKYADADQNAQSLHNQKQHSAQLLKNIKQFAEQDNLNKIIDLLKDNETFLHTAKNVKALMAYAIKSKNITVLKYGFQNDWFTSIKWNENIITVDYSGFTPLGYSLKKMNNVEAAKLFISHGASMDNKITAAYDENIKSSMSIPLEVRENLSEFEKTIKIIKLRNTLENTMPEKDIDTQKYKI